MRAGYYATFFLPIPCINSTASLMNAKMRKRPALVHWSDVRRRSAAAGGGIHVRRRPAVVRGNPRFAHEQQYTAADSCPFGGHRAARYREFCHLHRRAESPGSSPSAFIGNGGGILL